MANKHFSTDFDLISDVKANDTFLVEDSDDGVVKKCHPSQVWQKFDDLDSSVAAAAQSASDAADSEANALSYKNAAAQSASDALGYKNDAAGSASDAHDSEVAAAGSANDALGYKNAAAGSASDAHDSELAAAASAVVAGDKADDAANALAGVNEELAALAALVDNAGDHKAISYDAEEAYKVCGFRTVISGAGVPSLETIPEQFGIPAFIGQLYIDTSAASGGLYYAVGTSSISDWKNA